MKPARAIFEQQVLPLFEANRAQWLDAARATALELGRRQANVTIDDVRAKCPPPANVDPRVMGAVFQMKIWEKIGYRQSDRRECHGRVNAVFRLRFDSAAKEQKP